MSATAAPISRARWLVRRNAWIERWRFGLKLRVYHGFGNPRFEFEFRLGFPRKQSFPLYLELEAEDS